MPKHLFYRRLQQDKSLCELFKDLIESELKAEEDTLHNLAQDALFNSAQIPYALCQYGKVDAYKSFLNITNFILRQK